MNYYWQLRRSRHLQLFKKYLPLHLAWRVIVKVVEPDLAPSNDFRTLR